MNAINLLPDSPEQLRLYYEFQERQEVAFVLAEGARFVEWGASMSENALSKLVGKSRAYVQQRKAVYLAHPAVFAAYQTRRLTYSQMRAIAQRARRDEVGSRTAEYVPDHDWQRRALDAVLAKLAGGMILTEEDVKGIVDQVKVDNLS